MGQMGNMNYVVYLIIQKINKTHHLSLDLCVIVIVRVSVVFGADLAVIWLAVQFWQELR